MYIFVDVPAANLNLDDRNIVTYKLKSEKASNEKEVGMVKSRRGHTVREA